MSAAVNHFTISRCFKNNNINNNINFAFVNNCEMIFCSCIEMKLSGNVCIVMDKSLGKNLHLRGIFSNRKA